VPGCVVSVTRWGLQQPCWEQAIRLGLVTIIRQQQQQEARVGKCTVLR
jgi:hypothetical protein